MWLSDDNPDYVTECTKDQTKEKQKFRSNSPPFEGGESLCEFFVEPSEQNDKLKSIQLFNAFSESFPDDLPSINSKQQNEVFPNVNKLPNENFISLCKQELLPTNSFTQSFLQSILSSIENEDPVVANAWTETLLDVIDLLPKEILKGEILNLAVNKGQLSQPVSSRLLCCKMLGKICTKFDPYIIKKEVLPLVLSLCQDVDYEVRGFMCRQLSIIAKGVGLETTKSSILPEIVELSNDEEAFVRLAGIETVVSMLPMLDDETCTQAIIPLVKKFCENSLNSKDSTLPIVAKQLGHLCHGLAANLTPEQKKWFLKFFREISQLGLLNQEKISTRQFGPMPDLLPDVDHKDRYKECRWACAYNFPAMTLFTGPENFLNELYPTFKELIRDPFQNTRQTMASGFYEIAKRLNSNSSLLLPELVHLLQDDSIEVLKGLIPHLPESLKAICSMIQSPTDAKSDQESELVKALITCEEAISVTSNWRLHADFLTRLSCLPNCISSEIIFTTFVPLLFIKLHTVRPIPCRTASAYSLLMFLRSTLSLERRKGIINELIREFCYGKSCHKRMLFIWVCELVIELFSKAFFKLYFFNPLLSLSADPVPNIRLRLCKILPRLKSLIKLPKDSSLLQQLESCVKNIISNEKDKDVSAGVSKAIQVLDKIEVATEPILRRSSCIGILIDVEDELKENEERQLLEVEFNSKLARESKISKTTAMETNDYKSAKIPVRKSGTLPKSAKTKDNQYGTLENHSSSPNSKSLKCIKQERRISSPLINVDVHKSNVFHYSKENQDLFNNTSHKTNIINNRSNTSSVRTWPRQKKTSGIPKQSLDRCPSPMPPPRRFLDQNNLETSFTKPTPPPSLTPLKKMANALTENSLKIKSIELKTSLSDSNMKYSSNETKKKISTTPSPSPETSRRILVSNNIESKIPTSNSNTKRKSLIRDS